jgi:hypothetical protein
MEFTFPSHWATRTWKASGSLTVFGAYQDYASGARFFEFCRCLSSFFGATRKVMHRALPFAELTSRRWRVVAAEEAGTADMVVISAYRTVFVPAEIEIWLDSWRTTTCALPLVLCAIFQPSESIRSQALQTVLQDFAGRHRLEFFLAPNL